MMPFEPGSWLPALFSGIQEAAAPTIEALEAAARPDVVASKLRFLTAAYTAVWIILAGYLFLLSMRQRRLERAIRVLRERLRLS
jgi:CcmD family protein